MSWCTGNWCYFIKNVFILCKFSVNMLVVVYLGTCSLYIQCQVLTFILIWKFFMKFFQMYVVAMDIAAQRLLQGSALFLALWRTLSLVCVTCFISCAWFKKQFVHCKTTFSPNQLICLFFLPLLFQQYFTWSVSRDGIHKFKSICKITYK